MKSPQLVRLQQQFLKSLHSGVSPWLLQQVEPAHGFGTAENVLNTYLKRAESRTIDPLKQTYRHLQWLLGEEGFRTLIDDFYKQSLGEPLSAQALNVEFSHFLSSCSEETYRSLLPLPLTSVEHGHHEIWTILVGAAMLDWRLAWCAVAPRRDCSSPDELLQELHHRDHLWARPRLDRGTRLMHSIIDLKQLMQAASQSPRQGPIQLHREPRPYLIHLSPQETVEVQQLDENSMLILGGCDGTQTLCSIIYEQTLHGSHREAVMERIRQLIQAGIIVKFQSELAAL